MVIVFVLEILVPTRGIPRDAASTELITLQISDWYRVVAMLVGAGLISLVALLRLLETTNLRGFVSALAVVRIVAGGLWLAQPILVAMGFGSLVLFFVVIVAVCVVIGVPIAFTFGIATLSYLAYDHDHAADDRRSTGWMTASPTCCCWRCRCSSFSAC